MMIYTYKLGIISTNMANFQSEKSVEWMCSALTDTDSDGAGGGGLLSGLIPSGGLLGGGGGGGLLGGGLLSGLIPGKDDEEDAGDSSRDARQIVEFETAIW